MFFGITSRVNAVASTAKFMVPDADEIENSIEYEMRKQVDHNLAVGYIELTGDGHFKYSKRGLFFLWGQFLKDMVRLC